MAATPDRQPGPSLEEEIQWDDRTADGDPSVTGALRRVGNEMRFKEAARVRVLWQGEATVPKTLLDNAGGFVYTGDGDPLVVS